MICPNCKYEHGYTDRYDENNNYIETEEVSGDCGVFFEMENKAERDIGGYTQPKRERVFGCPKCGVMFINVDSN